MIHVVFKEPALHRSDILCSSSAVVFDLVSSGGSWWSAASPATAGWAERTWHRCWSSLMFCLTLATLLLTSAVSPPNPASLCLPPLFHFPCQGSWSPSDRWGRRCSSNINWRMTFPPSLLSIFSCSLSYSTSPLHLHLFCSSLSYQSVFSRRPSPPELLLLNFLQQHFLISVILSLGVGKWAGSHSDGGSGGSAGISLPPLPSSSSHSSSTFPPFPEFPSLLPSFLLSFLPRLLV